MKLNSLACTLLHMTLLKALLGMTTHAAKALGEDNRGRIVVGSRADFCVWDAANPSAPAYGLGFNPLHARIYEDKL